MEPANAIPAWEALKKAAKLLQGVTLASLSEDGAGGEAATKKAGADAIGGLLANLGAPEVREIEALVFGCTKVVPEEGAKPYSLDSNLNHHFNKHRGHLMRVLFEGVRYQYADFFSGGGLSGLMGGMLNKLVPPA
ncbi:Phage tail assemb.y chaperone protein, TAC [compost metagenome]